MNNVKIGSMLFTQQRATPGTTFEALRQQAKDAGLKKLGNGVFGVTFEHPTDNRLVIKIGREQTRVNRVTQCVPCGAWMDWTLTSQQNLSAAFRPVVVSLTSYDSPASSAVSYIAVMERLQPLDLDTNEHDRIIREIDSHAESLIDFRGRLRVGKAAFTCEQAKETSLVIKSLWNYHGDDLHSGNLMVRVVNGKRIPIITDPVA